MVFVGKPVCVVGVCGVFVCVVDVSLRLVCIDCDKRHLIEYYEKLLSSSLVRPHGGLIVIDNVLFKRSVLNVPQQQQQQQSPSQSVSSATAATMSGTPPRGSSGDILPALIDAFNKHVAQDNRVETVNKRRASWRQR